MVAHGVSRGEIEAGFISPEGDTSKSKDMEGASKYRPPGSCEFLRNSTHGLRRGLPSAALRAETNQKTITSAVVLALKV
jgi:hypothetical protein